MASTVMGGRVLLKCNAVVSVACAPCGINNLHTTQTYAHKTRVAACGCLRHGTLLYPPYMRISIPWALLTSTLTVTSLSHMQKFGLIVEPDSLVLRPFPHMNIRIPFDNTHIYAYGPHAYQGKTRVSGLIAPKIYRLHK